MLLSWPSVLPLSVFCALIIALKWYLRTNRLYPPGPPVTSWVLGNANLPKRNCWLKFTDWANTYGDIVYFRILKRHNIVINSLEVAYDLLDKRSSLYSSRVHLPILNLMGWDWSAALIPNDDKWKAHRRFFQQYFSQDASRKYEHVQMRKIHDFLANLLVTPQDFLSHIRHSSGAVIMSIVYDHDVAPENDHFIDLAKTALANLSEGVNPAQPLNILPILSFIPEWLYGGSWTRFCKESKIVADKMLHEPVELVVRSMGSGNLRPCIAAELIERHGAAEGLRHVEDLCGNIYTAGADTTVSAIEAFFYAMVNYPEVQIKAQAEIDAVVGRDRLPDFEDRASLPYVEALCREVLRWCPVLPISVAHCTTQDDIYNGYYIPKGTAVIPNVWAMTRDASRYKHPEVFDPSRFLDQDNNLNNDDVGYVFGFGRRICPGRHLGFSTIWITISSVLATFNLQRAKDPIGQDIQADSSFGGEMIMHCIPFECAITPRSGVANQLVEDAISIRD